MAGDDGDRGRPDDLALELERLRRREARYVALLDEAQARAERSRGFTLALGELSASDLLSRAGLSAALAEIAGVSAARLGVARSSVWLVSEDARSIECVCLVEAGEVRTPPAPLASTLAPAYFASVASARVIAVSEAWTDPRTRELGPSYLEPHGVTAILDAPIRAFGSLVGIVCNEHVAGLRAWTDEEQSFAAAIGDLAALAITTAQRERAEAIAESSAARYRHLVESLPCAVYSFHPSAGALDYVSPQIEALTGEPPSRFVGPRPAERWLAHVHPEDVERVRGRFDAFDPDGEPASRVARYRILRADGTERWVRDSFRVVRNADGRPLGVQGLLEDVTEASLAERERDEQKRLFRDLVAHTDLMALFLDAEGRVTFANDALLRVFGRTREELLHQDWFELMVPEDQRETVRAVVLGGMRADAIERVYENDVVTSRGERRRVRFSNTVIRDGSGRIVGAASLAVDLTDRLELEARLLEAQKLESLGRLASGIAHDFNNVLTAVRGSVELVSHAVARDPRVERHLEIIRDSTTRAAEMTSALLGFARRRPIDPTTFELDAMVRSALPTLRAAVGPSVVLAADLHAEGALVRADEGGLYQVLLNLVLNARDASQRGATVTIGTEIVYVDAALGERLLGLPPGCYATLFVRDRGHGMAEDVARRVFEPFFTTKPDGEGTGLGLATSYGIVRQAGGQLGVETELGRGSVFTVHLPRVDAR